MNSQALCACGCGQPAPIAKQTRRGTRRGEPLRYIRFHRIPRLKGEQNPSWRGGRYHNSGYVSLKRPGHPRATKAGYVCEHILVVEAALGRSLPDDAVVHHVDENRGNNANTNLVACQDRAYHNLLHRRMRALAACGDPNAKRCKICHGYSNQHDIMPSSRKEDAFVHRECHNARRRGVSARWAA